MGRMVGSRESIDLDGPWRFDPDPDGRLGPGDLMGGEGIRVPGCWEAQSDDWRGLVTGWYRRPIDVPAEWQGSRVILAFGAVMYHATVFVNGTRVGEHEGGYTPFELDATDLVDWGASNELAVRVVNPLGSLRSYPAWSADLAEADARTPKFPASEVPHGKQTWYSSQSGIWQSIRAERRPRPSLAPLRVRVAIADSGASIRWGVDLDGAGSDEPWAIELTLLGPDGEAAR